MSWPSSLARDCCLHDRLCCPAPQQRCATVAHFNKCNLKIFNVRFRVIFSCCRIKNMSENARTLLQTGVVPSPAVLFPLTPLPSVSSSFLSPIFSEKLSTTDSDGKGQGNLSSAMNRSDSHPFRSPQMSIFYLFCSITIDLDGDRYVRSFLTLTPH